MRVVAGGKCTASRLCTLIPTLPKRHCDSVARSHDAHDVSASSRPSIAPDKISKQTQMQGVVTIEGRSHLEIS